MKKILFLFFILTLLLFTGCKDGDDYDKSRSLVGLWAANDYRILPAGPPQSVKLYILPDKTFYFLYYTNITDPVPLMNVSVKGDILADIDLYDYPWGGQFLQFDITHEFDGSTFIPSALPTLNVFIDELGITTLRFHNDVDNNYILMEPMDEIGYFMRLVE